MPMPKPPLANALTYDPELGPGYFVQSRSDFLRSRAFSPTAKLLYLVLLSYAGEGAVAWPGQVRLAAEVGVSERTIRAVLTAELIPAGLVSVERQGLNRTNRYHLHKLPTLGADRQNLPLPHKARPDRQRLPLLNGTARRSRPVTVAGEVHPAETQTGEGGAPPAPSDADRMAAARAGVTLAQWMALRADAPAYDV